MKLSFIYGTTAAGWFRLLRENHYRVNACYWHRALFMTTLSFVNSLLAWHEQIRVGRGIERTVITEPPVFVLGHWRNGTSHLQRLLACDGRFCTPNVFQTVLPRGFLTWETSIVRLLKGSMPPTRPEDQMSLSYSVPSEDEIALANLCQMSLYLMWTFPVNAPYYRRYLTLGDCSERELSIWKDSMLYLVKKLTFKHGKPILLKSPAHTARIGILLSMFPEARFVHIHRNPYRVFQSTRHLMTALRRHHAILQDWSIPDLNDQILSTYRSMYDAFFAQVGLIPDHQFHELGFEDLKKDPISELERLYSGLSLGGFGRCRPAFERYTASVSNYQQNSYEELAPTLKRRISNEWRKCIVAWGYE